MNETPDPLFARNLRRPLSVETLRVDTEPEPPSRRRKKERADNLLRQYVTTLLRWRWAILGCALVGLLASQCLHLSTLPIFRARTSLDIQSINSDFMNMRNVAPTGEAQGSSNEAYVQTQIKLLQSETLLERTVARLEAEAHPEFIERGDLLSNIKRALHLGRSESLSYRALVDQGARLIKVKPLGVTRLVEITCDSWDAQFSAKFCNTLTDEFKEEDLEIRSSEAQKTSDWLTRQVADIKLKAEESQRKLEAATGGDGLMLSADSNSVGEDRLRQMQAELVRAQADRMEREAQSGAAAAAAPGTTPTVLDDPNYRNLQQRLTDLQGKVAELVPPLTEENPKVIHLRSEIRETEAAMDRARGTSSDRMRNEYDAARHREALLSAAYRAQEANVSAQLGKAAKVNLLRREVESEQQLYQTLLQRAKEAGFASAMQASTIRVVDAARAPKIPVSPRRGTTGGLGILLGSAIGLSFAFVRDRNSDVFRAPGDIERLLDVQELGVIPAATAGPRAPVLGGLQSSLVRRSHGEPGVGEALTMTRWNEHFSIVAEAYRSTTFSLLLGEAATRRTRVYVVSSPNAGEGKTTVISNLGVALGQSKRRVVLIDGDLRKPGLHRQLRVPNNFGLRNILRGEINPETATLGELCRATAVPNLSVIPSGTGSEEVVELLHSPSVGDLLARLSRDFDMVLIDTPPMLHMADARIFAGQSDGAILVVRAGVTTREEAEDARDLLEHDRAYVVGAILNDFNPHSEGRRGYYRSYYRYREQVEAGLRTRAPQNSTEPEVVAQS